MTRDEEVGGGRVRGNRFEQDEGGRHRGVVSDEEMGRRRWTQADPTSRPMASRRSPRCTSAAQQEAGRGHRGSRSRSRRYLPLDPTAGWCIDGGGSGRHRGSRTRSPALTCARIRRERTSHCDESGVRRDLIYSEHFEVDQIGPLRRNPMKRAPRYQEVVDGPGLLYST